jgi:hypothetical protein
MVRAKNSSASDAVLRSQPGYFAGIVGSPEKGVPVYLGAKNSRHYAGETSPHGADNEPDE